MLNLAYVIKHWAKRRQVALLFIPLAVHPCAWSSFACWLCPRGRAAHFYGLLLELRRLTRAILGCT